MTASRNTGRAACAPTSIAPQIEETTNTLAGLFGFGICDVHRPIDSKPSVPLIFIKPRQDLQAAFVNRNQFVGIHDRGLAVVDARRPPTCGLAFGHHL